MPLSDEHRRVIAVALAAAGHGFALGGGNALLAHGMTTRPTQDVDLFTDQEDGVQAAGDAVESALLSAGFHVDRGDQAGELTDIFPGMGEGLAEWLLTSPQGEQTTLQMAYFTRTRDPIPTELGPVLAVEDVAGGKVCALASRVEPRDYLDTARLLERYTPAALIALARRLDPGLTARDFADAGRHLDDIDNDAFTRYGLDQNEIAAVREGFTVWPRTIETADREMRRNFPGAIPPARSRQPADRKGASQNAPARQVDRDMEPGD